jgi:hypothetical protein
LLPLAASSTAFPVPAQLFSADWMREVSGGADSALLLNSSLLVDSVAVSVVQVDGMLGWPEAGGELGDEDGLGEAEGEAECEALVGDALVGGALVGGVVEEPPLHAAPLRVKAVGLVFVLVYEPLNPIDVLAPVARAPL